MARDLNPKLGTQPGPPNGPLMEPLMALNAGSFGPNRGYFGGLGKPRNPRKQRSWKKKTSPPSTQNPKPEP